MNGERICISFSPLATRPAVMVKLSKEYPWFSGAFNTRLSKRIRPFTSSMELPVKSALRLKEISESTYLPDKFNLFGRKF